MQDMQYIRKITSRRLGQQGEIFVLSSKESVANHYYRSSKAKRFNKKVNDE